jgi:hypothetical protein
LLAALLNGVRQAPHGVDAGQEGVGFGQLRQSEHLGRIGITELDDGVVAGLRCDGPRREHLHALGGARGHQTVRYADCRHLQHKDGLAFTNQPAQRCMTGQAVVACRGEQVDVAAVALGEIAAFGEVRCMRQRGPDGPAELVHRTGLLRAGARGTAVACAARCSSGVCSRATSSAAS